MICFSLSNLRRLQHHGSAIATYPCNLHSYPPPQSGKRSELFEQRISELILLEATFLCYLGTTSIEPDNLGNRRYVFRFADQEGRVRWMDICLSYQIWGLRNTNFSLLQGFQYTRHSGLEGATDGVHLLMVQLI